MFSKSLGENFRPNFVFGPVFVPLENFFEIQTFRIF